ncbi:GntR family transcriptional regulator [Streptomyces sp. N35]|uniref:GntR family transcriptional regulator n=1 Tax=Streptomyces sp. N35 TaxID=2795730 RepID=UPI0027DCC594|nr:GntR family transcriptional regulator [Streptomyces sp. N35]
MARVSLTDLAYDALLRRILDAELKSGARLVERHLAAELAVSRIPLREALRRLEADGLVVLVPHRGALVSPFTPADVRDLFDVRESLESLAARLAAERADSDGLARLAGRIATGRTAIAAQDRGSIATANAGFHTDIVELADNPLLSNMMRLLEARTYWLFRLTAQRDPAQQCAEHEEMYEAIAAGDGDRAAALAHGTTSAPFLHPPQLTQRPGLKPSRPPSDSHAGPRSQQCSPSVDI